ncbi:hypothetical protein [Nonomuraea salmonea]|uniref:hypothetical protein n=1 Tax=Nonomuraea salmonea TaxID=46181 RepID=UPI002FE78DB1
MFRYAVRLCWLHAYPAPNLRIYVNGSTQIWPVSTGTTSTPGCQMTTLYAAEVAHGAAVANVRFEVTGGLVLPGQPVQHPHQVVHVGQPVHVMPRQGRGAGGRGRVRVARGARGPVAPTACTAALSCVRAPLAH